MSSPRRTPRRIRRRDEAGYAAIFVALLGSVLFMGMAAMGVDTARWYVEAERIQKTADAASLAGVTYMPNDFAKAKATALTAAAKNGYDDASANVVITVTVGSKPSELQVTISSKVNNSFGAGLGVRSAWVTRSAVADYTAPAPMGSPCNTFGNEPPGSAAGPPPTGTALPIDATRFPNCPLGGSTDSNPGMSSPKFWAGVEGPETDKLQGDRYQALKCTETGNTGGPTFGCASSENAEYKQQGYYFIIHVEPLAVGTPIDVQVYDPAFVPAGLTCGSLPGGVTDNMNDWVTDGTDRYGNANPSSGSYNPDARKFCPGDAFVGASTTSRATATTFQMRNKTLTSNPDKSAALGSCPAKQFRGFTNAPSGGSLSKGSGSYNDQLAQVFHQWVSVCTFTPAASGDYYLQVRTNVALAGTAAANTNGNNPVIYTGNPAADDDTGDNDQGAGANAFAVRAVTQPASGNGMRDDVAVSAWERMPILQIAASPATFNLVRALPNSNGQYLTFDFYDSADGSDGDVKVLPPADATGSVKAPGGISGCKAGKNNTSPSAWTALSGCSYHVTGNNTDGQLIHMVIPIPNDYDCDDSTLGGCWFQVTLYNFGSSVTDFTTWSANIGGDPVRLVN
jgi:Flp pilus assembly protein TadG